MNFLGLDVGTTRIKCGVYDESGSLLFLRARDYALGEDERRPCVDVTGLWQTVRALLAEAAEAAPFATVAVSSLGESFALLDGADRLLVPPLLYTDERGREEAEALSGQAERIFALSGVFPQSMYSAYKLAWIKARRPALFARAKKVLLVGEYVGYLLTGNRLIDYGLAARTGLFDVRRKRWSEELLALFGLPEAWFAPPAPAGSVVGEVKPALCAALGLPAGCRVVLGSHDQICSALGAGGLEAGVCVDGMGTVECITALYETPSDDLAMGRSGYPAVPYATGGLYCTYLLNYSCGSTTQWVKKLMSAFGAPPDDFFARAEAGFGEGPTGLLFLPYLGGAATPFQEITARGAILNLGLETSPADLYKGVLEGLCMEMRLNLEETERYGVRPERLIATGGGSNSRVWLQLKADITGLPVFPLVSGEAGICGTALLGAAAATGRSLGELAASFVKYGEPLLPRQKEHLAYAPIYEKYKSLYAAVRNF